MGVLFSCWLHNMAFLNRALRAVSYEGQRAAEAQSSSATTAASPLVCWLSPTRSCTTRWHETQARSRASAGQSTRHFVRRENRQGHLGGRQAEGFKTTLRVEIIEQLARTTS
jgi:hypothetical protein